MIGLNVLFWILVILFAFIGSMRGWAKELLVTFAAILGLFIITVLEKYVPFIRDNLVMNPSTSLFWFRSIVIGVLVFAGYQTPNLPKLAETNRFARDRFQDLLLGLFLGAINAFLIFGSIWWYMHQLEYPFDIISAPLAGTASGDAALQLVKILPPSFLGAPVIYFAVAIAFAFLMVVFI